MADIGYSGWREQTAYFIIKSGAKLCITFHLKEAALEEEEVSYHALTCSFPVMNVPSTA